jgi:hypothetical protein
MLWRRKNAAYLLTAGRFQFLIHTAPRGGNDVGMSERRSLGVKAVKVLWRRVKNGVILGHELIPHLEWNNQAK